jgi:integrase
MGHERGHKASTRASETAGIYQRTGSPYWWCRFYSARGERQLESTKCTDRKAALAYLARRQREVQEPVSPEREAATLRAALKALVADREERAKSESGSRSEATARFYFAKSKVLLGHFGPDYLLRDLTAAALDAYVSARRAAKVKDTTIHKELTTIRAALKIAKRSELWVGDIGAVLPEGVSGQSEPRTRWLTRAELDAVLKDMRGREGRADRAARVAFVVATSAEWSATERARREDVTADREYVYVRGEKRATRDRDVPIRLAWQRELLAFAIAHADGRDGLLFKPWLNSNSNRELGRCAVRLGIEPFTWNDLRRTTAQWLRREAVELELVSAILGHADGRMVERTYGKLDAKAIGDRLARLETQRT